MMVKKKNCGDWFKRIVTFLVFWAFLGYVCTFFFQDIDAFLEKVNSSHEEVQNTNTEEWNEIMESNISSNESGIVSWEISSEVVQEEDKGENDFFHKPVIFTKQMFFISCIVLVVVCLYFIVVYGISSFYVPYGRAIALIMGIWLIIFSQYLPNSGELQIYLWDLTSVLWVFTLILYPTNLLLTEKAKKAKEKKEEIVIEA